MDHLALICEEIARHSSRLQKIGILADYLRKLSDDDLQLAVRFLSGVPVADEPVHQTLFGPGDKPRLSVGYSVLREALERVLPWDRETTRLCYQEVGDGGETIGLLLRGFTQNESLTLERANNIYQHLFHLRLTAKRIDVITEVFRTYRPLTIKYFVKIIFGSLRIGLQGKMVEEAIAAACGVSVADVKDANNRLGNLSHVAWAARHGQLTSIEARLFHPMEFMLAKPLDQLEDLPTPADWLIEEKYDGIRSQVHIDYGQVRIYSRSMEEITRSFPEIEECFRSWPQRAILDGELLAWRNGRALNFNVLQQRIARKRVSASLLAGVPVIFMAYDLLLQQEELLLNRPIEERRARLQAAFADGRGSPILISPQVEAENHGKIDRLFLTSRENGNEGLVLKRRGSIYESGKRSGLWFKLKRPYGTLDVVVTAAEQGHGKRATVFSDYTFAVRSGNSYVNIGKAYSGLTDPEIKELTKILRAASFDRFGRVMLVKPEVVLEVAFDGVQKSARHKSGYALRFPRIVRWRRDKSPGESDDLDRVKALYEASLVPESGD